MQAGKPALLRLAGWNYRGQIEKPKGEAFPHLHRAVGQHGEYHDRPPLLVNLPEGNPHKLGSHLASPAILAQDGSIRPQGLAG